MILIYDVTSESPEHIATVEDGEQTYGDFEVDIMEEDAMLHRYNGPTVIATKVEDDDLAQVGRQAASAGLTLGDWERSPTPETRDRWYSPSRDEYRYQKTEPGSGGKSEYEKMREREARREEDIANMPTEERLQNAFSLASDTQTAREAGITTGASVADEMSVLSYSDGSRDFAVPVSAHNTYITRQLTQENQARANNEVGPDLTELFGGKSCKVEIVYHNGEDHIVKEGIDGPLLTDVVVEAREEGREVDPDILDSVFDLMASTWLTGNRDVHGGNIIINDNNEAVLIDHDSGPFSDDDDLLFGDDYAEYEGQKAIRFINVQTGGDIGYDPFVKRGLEVAVRVVEGEVPLPDTLGPEQKEAVRERAMRLINYEKQFDEFKDYVPDRLMKALQRKQWIPHYNRDGVQVGWKDANNPSDIRYQQNMPGSGQATEDAAQEGNDTDDAGLTDADYDSIVEFAVLDRDKLKQAITEGGDPERIAEALFSGEPSGPQKRSREKEIEDMFGDMLQSLLREDFPVTVEVEGEELEMGLTRGSYTDYMLERLDLRYPDDPEKADDMFYGIEYEMKNLTVGAGRSNPEVMALTNALARRINPNAMPPERDWEFDESELELMQELEAYREESIDALRQVFGDTITVYRGEQAEFYNEEVSDSHVGVHRPIESWTINPGVTLGFADGPYGNGAILKRDIPVEKAVFSWFNGAGYPKEAEVGVALDEIEEWTPGEDLFYLQGDEPGTGIGGKPSEGEPVGPPGTNMSRTDLLTESIERFQDMWQTMQGYQQEQEQAEGRELAVARTLQWEGYKTDTGQQAWYNTVTQERRYQENKPGTQGDGNDEEAQQEQEQLPPEDALQQRLDLIDVEEQLIEGAIVETADGLKINVTGAADNFNVIYGVQNRGGEFVNMVVSAEDIANVIPSPESSIIEGDLADIAEDNDLDVFEPDSNMFQAAVNAGFDEPFPDAITYMDSVAFEMGDGAYLVGDVMKKNGMSGSADPVVSIRTRSGDIRDMNLADAVGVKRRYEGYDSIQDVPTQERLQNPFDFAVERGKMREYGNMKGGQTGHAMEIVFYEDGSRDFLTPVDAMGESDEVRERRAQRNVVQARLGNSMMPDAFAKTERATDPDTGREYVVKEGIKKRKGGPRKKTFEPAPPEIAKPVAVGCLLGNSDLHKNNVITTEGGRYGKAVLIDHDFFGRDASVAAMKADWASPGRYMEQVAVDIYNNRDNIDAEGLVEENKRHINTNFKREFYRAASKAKSGDVQNVPAEFVRIYEEAESRKEGMDAMPDVIP